MTRTIGKQLRDVVRDAADHSSVVASDDDVHVTVDIEHAERYGVGVRGISVRPTGGVADVGEAAERIARDVDAVDDLRVVEYDRDEGEAILRSVEPQRDADGVDYWEATVNPTETTVQRYRKTHDEPERAVVVEPFSYRALGDLADQLAEALTPASPSNGG